MDVKIYPKGLIEIWERKRSPLPRKPKIQHQIKYMNVVLSICTTVGLDFFSDKALPKMYICSRNVNKNLLWCIYCLNVQNFFYNQSVNIGLLCKVMSSNEPRQWYIVEYKRSSTNLWNSLPHLNALFSTSLFYIDNFSKFCWPGLQFIIATRLQWITCTIHMPGDCEEQNKWIGTKIYKRYYILPLLFHILQCT